MIRHKSEHLNGSRLSVHFLRDGSAIKIVNNKELNASEKTK